MVIVAGLPLLVAAGCGAIESFNPVTRQGLSIANLFVVVLVISAVIFLLVAGVETGLAGILVGDDAVLPGLKATTDVVDVGAQISQDFAA